MSAIASAPERPVVVRVGRRPVLAFFTAMSRHLTGKRVIAAGGLPACDREQTQHRVARGPRRTHLPFAGASRRDATHRALDPSVVRRTTCPRCRTRELIDAS